MEPADEEDVRREIGADAYVSLLRQAVDVCLDEAGHERRREAGCSR